MHLAGIFLFDPTRHLKSSRMFLILLLLSDDQKKITRKVNNLTFLTLICWFYLIPNYKHSFCISVCMSYCYTENSLGPVEGGLGTLHKTKRKVVSKRLLRLSSYLLFIFFSVFKAELKQLPFFYSLVLILGISAHLSWSETTWPLHLKLVLFMDPHMPLPLKSCGILQNSVWCQPLF